MSWDKNDSPWKQNKPGNSGGGNRPPRNDQDFEELFRKGHERMRDMFGKGGGGGKQGGDGGMSGKGGAWIMIAVLVILWAASGFYIVDTQEQGVVLRFGEYHRTEPPGLKYHFPWPVERVYTPRVTDINKVEIGFREDNRGRQGRISIPKESLMLTGDLNIVDVNFVVQWKVDSTSTEDFLFNVRRADALVKPVAESAMREVIGQMDLEKIITDGQTDITNNSKTIMQAMLNDYGAGVQIVSVNLNKPDVPGDVIDAFQDVKRAEQEKNTLINKAEAYRNDILPRARGRAVKIEQQALAYKREVTEQAQGDVARFLSVYEEYRQAKDVTRQRLYLETMENILANMNKFIIDKEGGGGVLPYLPLNEVRRNTGGQQ